MVGGRPWRFVGAAKGFGTMLAVAACVAVSGGTPLVAQSRAPACADRPEYSQLDFWVGEWRVTDEAGTLQGTNRIEKVLSSCAVLEHWTDAGGSEGKSLFYFDVAGDRWKQVWVTERATVPGGMKEKELIEVLGDGGVRFQGTIRLPDGRTYLDRTTLTPLEDGRVRQHIQTSSDGGQTWAAGWVGIYGRIKDS